MDEQSKTVSPNQGDGFIESKVLPAFPDKYDPGQLGLKMGPAEKTYGFFQIYGRIMDLATFQEKLLYAVGIVASMGSGAVLPLMTLIFGNFVSVFTDFALDRIPGDEFRGKVNSYTLYFVYLFAAKAACTYIYMLLFTIVAANINSAIRRKYVNVVLHQRIAYHETVLTSGAVALALSTHSNAIRSGLAEKFGLSLKSVSTVVAAFVVAIHSQWKLALVTATIIPAAVLVVGVTSVFDERKEESLNLINAEAATLADEVLSSMRTVRALGAEGSLSSKYEQILKRAVAVGLQRAPIKGLQAGTYMFMLYGGYALAFWYGLKLFVSGEAASSGVIITTLFSIMIGVNAFSELAGYVGPFLRVKSAGVELFRVIDSTSTYDVGGETPEGSNTSGDAFCYLQEDLAFNNVSFSYPTRPNITVLNKLTLSIPAGKTTALVGPSGSGKSTIVGLLLRWYDASSGVIRIGEQTINDCPFQALRRNIGLVQQEPYLFTGTIYENIEYGLCGSPLELLPSDEKRRLIMEACQVANAHDFITKLTDGYDTPIGNRGTMLSGGQKQRLAIARAIVKNPPILILDEATSALDATSEAIVQQALDNARQSRTTIAIAHRLTTIQNADQIIVMKGGAVAEVGTHMRLLEQDAGIYRRLWEAQMLAGSTEAPQDEGEALQNAMPLSHRVSTNVSGAHAPDPYFVQSSRERGILTLIGHILSSQRKYWWIFFIICVSAAVGGALFPVQAYLYAKVVTTFQLSGAALVSRGNFWSLMWFVLAVVVGLGYLGVGWAGDAAGEIVSQDYRYAYFVSMLSQPMAFFDVIANSPGSLLSRLSSDPDAVNALAGSNLAVVVTVAVALLSCIVLALAVGWKLGLVVLFGGFPFIFGAGVVHERMQNSFEEKAGAMLTGSVSFATECIQAIRTVSSLNTESVIERRFGDMLEDYCRRARKYALRSMVWFALSDSIDLLCMALAFWYGGRLLSFHEYSTTQFFIVFISIVFGSQTTGQFFAHSSDISQGIASTRSIYELGDSIVEAAESHPSAPDLSVLDDSVPLIEFRDTEFAYPSRPSQRVLKRLGLKVYKGQSIALVGPSGCGKSTVIQLLEQFYDPTAGEILIAGKSLRDHSPAALRTMFALVSQEPVLYSGTIEENINLGRASPLSPAELQGVINQSQLDDLVASLPDGVRTEVGSRGTQLSGGQKQRIAIARAIAVDAPILLLDEATSALDSESERLIQTAIREGTRAKTVIAIAHRLSTIQHCDQIHVLDGGRIIESGTHSELMQQRGRYTSMVMSQSGTGTD